MKRILLIFLAVIFLFSLVACGGEKMPDNNNEETKQSEISYDRNDLNSMITAMEAEYEKASKSITDESVVMFEKIGDTYENYAENKDVVTDFYTNSFTVAEELYIIIDSISVDYFKCVASNGIKDYSEWNDNMEEFYNTWNDSMEDFYDIWNEIYEDLYDETEELVEDGEDNLPYSEYSDVWSDMYNEYSDSWSEMYELYSDAWGNTYENYTNVWSGFYDNNDDVDELLKKAIEEESESEDTTSEETITDETKTEVKSESIELVDGMRPEFKAAMDAYETFYDEYCDFMAKYKANPTDSELITEYADMMEEIVDMDEKFKEWENDNLNSEELKYYIEVSSRITQKMLDVAS